MFKALHNILVFKISCFINKISLATPFSNFLYTVSFLQKLEENFDHLASWDFYLTFAPQHSVSLSSPAMLKKCSLCPTWNHGSLFHVCASSVKDIVNFKSLITSLKKTEYYSFLLWDC